MGGNLTGKPSRSERPGNHSRLGRNNLSVGDEPQQSGGQRDHLFVSYAAEDRQLAEWLTLKLTGEGYKVWCDRVKLLGGESYPRDIDKAIKEQTFRVMALLSHNSIHKPNPLKERTLSHNISRERRLDFIIPLRVDRIAPTELDWMSSDLTYIDFSDNWAAGFVKLLEKLSSINAPHPLADGRTRVANWLSSMSSYSNHRENVWTNVLEVQEIPQTLYRTEFLPSEEYDWPEEWVFYKQSSHVFWSFLQPTFLVGGSKSRITLFNWRVAPGGEQIPFDQVVSVLLSRHLRLFCLKKGLKQSPNRLYLYFPPKLVGEDRLRFQNYTGRSAFVNAVGERTFRLSGGRWEKSRYHLSPVFRPNVLQYRRPVVQVLLRLFLTDLNGVALDERQINRRRKHICKDWWNHQWLSRLIGVASWMADGRDSFDIATDPSYRIVISGMPMKLIAPVGINESRLGDIFVDEESELFDDEVDEALHDDAIVDVQ